jgi:undecaprenyl-diphosphatase
MDKLIVLSAQYIIFISAITAVITTVFSKKTIRNNIIKLAILSFIIAFLVTFIAGMSYYNARPFVVENIEPLFPHKADNGFPSDHTLITLLLSSTVFVFRHKPGIILGILGVLTGVFRVLSNVHYPIDIIGSIIIALLATYIAWLILRRFDKNFKTPPE